MSKRKKTKRVMRDRVCQVCGRKAHSGSGYCLAHLPDELRCTAITNKRKRCSLPHIPGDTVCKVHKPGATSAGKNTGWIYVFDTRHVTVDRKRVCKIGRAYKPEMRESELRAGNPFGQFVFAYYVGGAVGRQEKYLHRQYADQLIERECFALSDADLRSIQRHLAGVANGRGKEPIIGSCYKP